MSAAARLVLRLAGSRPDGGDREGPDVDHLVVGAGDIVGADPARGVVAALVAPIGAARVEVEVDGRPIRGRSGARRVRAGLVIVSGTAVAPDVSVRDHVAAASTARTADRLLAGAPLLRERGSDPAGVLSGGERRALGWLTAVAVDPTVVVLDRAGTGLDEDTLAWAHATIDGWLDAGVAVVVVPGRDEEQRWVTHRADGSPRPANRSV